MKNRLSSRVRDLSLNLVICVIAISFNSQAETIYFDDVNDQKNIGIGGPYTQTLAGSSPTSSNFLPFTPDPSKTYTVQMTVDTTPLGGVDPGGTNSWFALGFTAFQHNWNGVDAATINTANLVRFNSNTVTTINYTVSGADLAAAGVQYVGWVTDHAGAVNLNSSAQAAWQRR